MRSEEEVLGFWARKKIFEKSIRKGGKKARPFIFFEGPPTANGFPGLHHVEARAFKDVVCRYKTMRGFCVERRAGWDTHGLPVEIEVEKKLGLKSKKDIEHYGVAAFNQLCRESVWTYKDEWEKLTRRMGFWLDMSDPYITYDTSYIESLWWIVKEFHKKKLLYEDDKIVPWCTRCGTALSSHELAQGYKKVTENSIYVRFRLKTRRASLLVWTTTPWTLPANVAAAVAPNLEYVTVEVEGEKFIVLATLAQKLFPDIKPLWREKGKNLVGLEYEAVFPHDGIPYTVMPADFISSEEGTGIVHIAPAFGEDDLRIGKKEKLPTLLTINEEGKFTKETPQFEGQYVKDADPLIVKDLKHRGLLWREAPFEHDYPFCWRCDSPLLYLSRKSWWVAVSRLRQELVDANKKINWYPEYFREGRFGGWIRETKDWAFSRERYWGTPLPVWQCGACGRDEVVGSIAEFKKCAAGSANTYYLLRYGFSKNNLLNIGSSLPEGDPYGLTSRGRAEVTKVARALKKEHIDLIISSDLKRTKESAAVLARELRVPVLFDDDMRDIHYGDHERTERAATFRSTWSVEELYSKPFSGPGGESWNDVKVRMMRVFTRLETLHKKKRILLVGHADPWWMMEGIMKGTLEPDAVPRATYLKNGEVHKVIPAVVPRNDRGELDLHKPFIDEITMLCPSCGTPMARTPGVIDVWFDSGSMPYAAWHYPFENKKRIDKKVSFPADFIVEGIDQTRGWFYLLLAISVLLGRGTSFKNVISLGHILDKTGKKMSKSRGNVVEPMKLFDAYGADAVRWYFFTINQPEDSKLFDSGDVDRAKKNFLDLLLNTLRFFELYRSTKPPKDKPSILDVWITSRLARVRDDMTRKMDSYDIVGAARALEHFVAEDVSRWYVRRSRERMRDGDGIRVLADVLREVAMLAAPFTPFISEIIYHALGAKGSSVHLAKWPEKRAYSKRLLVGMDEIRALAARGLELRARAGIKIRQPLASFTVKKTSVKQKELFEILASELNVKEIHFDPALPDDAALDTIITPELKEEGNLRELVRGIQDMRKKQTLEPRDSVNVYYQGSLSDAQKKYLSRGVRIKAFVEDAVPGAGLRVGGIVITKIEKA